MISYCTNKIIPTMTSQAFKKNLPWYRVAKPFGTWDLSETKLGWKDKMDGQIKGRSRKGERERKSERGCADVLIRTLESLWRVFAPVSACKAGFGAYEPKNRSNISPSPFICCWCQKHFAPLLLFSLLVFSRTLCLFLTLTCSVMKC